MTSPEIYTFEKTLQDRLDEFMDVLCTRGVSVPASQVVDEWRFYIREILEPLGWNALWKPSRLSCDKFCIKFPTFVYVEVLSTEVEVLCATIKILAVQDNVHLPEQIQVPLQHLYPTKVQTIDVLDIEGTANCLDQLRFFYDHVWQPWDIDDDETADWPSSHLESRIQLYFDMQSGIVFRETGEHIRALLQEGRNVQSQIAILEGPISEDDELGDDNVTFRLMELNVRKEQIKTELQMLENPVMRNLLVRKKQQMALSKRCPANGKSKQEVCFVWLGGSVDEFIQSLSETKAHVDPDAYIRSSPILQEALDQAIAGDTIILCAGVHGVRGSGGLEEGGVMKGISAPDATTLQAHNAGNVLFDCSANSVLLENITVDSHLVQTALLVRRGTLRLRNCHIVGKDNTSQGILVLSGAKLEAHDCIFRGLGMAIVVNSGGVAALTSCTVSDCNIGIQLFDDANLALEMCTVSGCKESGIQVETFLGSVQHGDSTIGSTVLLDGHINIKMANSLLENNIHGNVTMVQHNASVFYDSVDAGCIIPDITQTESE